MKYVLLLSLISCKPLIDRHDYIIHSENTFLICDEIEDVHKYSDCRDFQSEYSEVTVFSGVVLKKEE
jgi:hypothetical protein